MWQQATEHGSFECTACIKWHEGQQHQKNYLVIFLALHKSIWAVQLKKSVPCTILTVHGNTGNSHVYSIKFKQSAPLKPMTVGTKFTASTSHPWSKVQVRFRANPYIQDHFRMYCWTTRSFLLLKYVCRVLLNIGVSSWKTWILGVEVIV